MTKRIYLLLILSTLAWTSAAQSSVCEDGTACVTERNWHLGLALGYGQRSNPLADRGNLTLVVLPDIYYYGERWFFDNGRLGWSWQRQANYELSLVTRLNPERSYFSSSYLGNWFGEQYMAFTDDPFQNSVTEATAEVQQASGDPNWSLDAGLQLDWFPAPHWHIRSNLWGDLTRRHQGGQFHLRLARQFQSQWGQFQVRLEADWKSTRLIDYYYGVQFSPEQQDTSHFMSRYGHLEYQGQASWQPALTVSWSYSLNDHWRLLAMSRYQLLGSGMTNSPLVTDDAVTTFFMGVGYRF